MMRSRSHNMGCGNCHPEGQRGQTVPSCCVAAVTTNGERSEEWRTVQYVVAGKVPYTVDYRVCGFCAAIPWDRYPATVILAREFSRVVSLEDWVRVHLRQPMLPGFVPAPSNLPHPGTAWKLRSKRSDGLH